MRLRAWLAALGLLVLAWLLPAEARAYPWMVAHQYTQCAQCHVDPSGGSALTEYGRAQGEILLRTHYGEVEDDPGPFAEFLFGAVPLPDAVVAQVDVRGMLIPQPGNFRTILMQSDLRGGLQTKHVVAYGSIGVVSEGAFAARLVRSEDPTSGAVQPVARDYWLGVSPAKDLLIRAGRINLPFGVRSDNHVLFTRDATRTTVNDDQQLGLAVSYARGRWRGELMGIAGNFHVSPDAYRERGAVGTLAFAPLTDLELGLSGLFTTAALDVETLQPLTRQAYGAFGRWSPLAHVALLGELDLLLDRAGPDAEGTAGFATELEADWEVTQGLHLRGGGGACDPPSADDAAAMGRGWGGVQWFFLPRVDVRIDAMVGPLYCVPGAESRPMGMAQLHFYL